MNYKKEIYETIKSGFGVLRIISDIPANDVYILVNNFEESRSSNIASIDFNLVEGIDITDFLNKSVLSNDNSQFSDKLSQVISHSEPMRIKFSKHVPWMMFNRV